MCSRLDFAIGKLLHALEARRSIKSTVMSRSCDSLRRRRLLGWTKVYVPLVFLSYLILTRKHFTRQTAYDNKLVYFLHVVFGGV